MFKIFEVTGWVFERNKNGNPIPGKIAKTIRGSGVVRDCQETPGAIVRQVPALAACDSMNYNLYPIQRR